MINIKQVKDLSKDKQVILLHYLIGYAGRDYLKSCLTRYNIPGRTKIYKDGTYAWYLIEIEDDELTDSEKIKYKALTKNIIKILEYSSIEKWIEEYIHRHTVLTLLKLFNKIGISELDIHIENNLSLEGERNECYL